MVRYVRLWILLYLAFSLVFAVFVNHDLLVLRSDDLIWIKHKATRSEIAIGSAVAGLILSSLTTSLYILGERVVLALSRSQPPSDAEPTA